MSVFTDLTKEHVGCTYMPPGFQGPERPVTLAVFSDVYTSVYLCSVYVLVFLWGHLGCLHLCQLN